MSTKGTSVPVLLLSVLASIAASLLAVWLVSQVFHFGFKLSVVAVLSASICAAAVIATWRRKHDV